MTAGASDTVPDAAWPGLQEDLRLVIEASAPGRCGIIGNPSDMYGGSVISCTTAQRASCRLEAGGGGIAARSGDVESVFLTAGDLALAGDNLDLIRAALQQFAVEPAAAAMRVSVDTEIPMRAGLAGSTAILTALTGALAAWHRQALTPYRIAEIARLAEARILRVVCGLQDQHMAVFGGINFMDFAGKEMLEQREDEPLATVEPLQAIVPDPPLLLAHTGVQHNSGAVHASPRQRWLEGDPAVRRGYARLGELAVAGKRAVVERRWADLGALMNENHAIVAAIGGSGEANDRLIDAARAAGAMGAKLAGAGGGGTIVALTDEPDRLRPALVAAGAEAFYVPVPSPGLTITVGA